MDDFLAQQRFNELKVHVQRLNQLRPEWKDEFSPEFVVAIKRALNDYSMISSLKLDTAKETQEQLDVLTYIAMAIYESIERVIKRKRIEV